MIYRSDDIPSVYNKIAEISDNYIVWVTDNQLSNQNTYNAYIQFLNPSFSYIFINDYVPTKFSDANLYYNYINGLYGSYVDTVDFNYTLNTYEVDEDYITNDLNYSSDCLNVFWGQIGVCICVLWVFKQLSRLFIRGGLY